MLTHTVAWTPNPSKELYAKQEQMRSLEGELSQTSLVNNVWDNSFVSNGDMKKKKCFPIPVKSFIYISYHAPPYIIMK